MRGVGGWVIKVICERRWENGGGVCRGKVGGRKGGMIGDVISLQHEVQAV